jgi:outer membrane lipoprotein-sorting protein
LLAFSVIGCNKTEQSEKAAAVAAASNAQGNATGTTTAAPGKYKVKSGVIHSTLDAAIAGPTKMTTYFDNYGATEAQETMNEMKIMNQTIKIHNITIMKDGWIYNIDLEKKTGTRHKGSAISANMDYSSLSGEMAEKYHVKKESNETVAGKTCDVFSMDDGKNMKGRVATWQGIPMRVDMQMAGMPMKQTVESIETDVAVPADKFEVPADVKITDI